MSDLGHLTAVDAADVYKQDRLAGRLWRSREGVRFDYDAAYDGPPVATTLPRGLESVGPFPGGAVPPFFAGLLPEGRRLVLLQRALKTSADDELSQLLAVGGDTVGDVQVVPAGQVPIAPTPRLHASAAGELRFADLLAESVGGIDRVGIPGVQMKVSAQTQTVPVARGPGPRSDAVLKIEPGEFPGLVANEAACLAAARAAGLDTPEWERAADRDGVPGLLVRRFDREVAEDGVRAVAQEDGCQVLGVWPADKYRVRTEELVAALAAVCAAPKVAALELWRQVAFSFLAGNGDLHAKNLSVRRAEVGWVPTPVYDVFCTYPYGDHTLALPVAGRSREDVTRDRLVSAAAETGVPAAATERMLDRLLARTASLPSTLAETPGLPGRPEKLRRFLDARRRALGGGSSVQR